MSGKKPKSPLDLQRHFQRRWWLRYPALDMPDFNWINRQIKKNTDEARHIAKQSAIRSLWEIRVDGQWVPIVYDKKRGTVVTCLPRNEAYRRADTPATAPHPAP